jgi:hypothetical protein
MAQYAFTFTSGDTVTPTKLNDARTVSEIVNADIKSDAAIAGTKIAPNFGSQNVVTTGNVVAGASSIPLVGALQGLVNTQRAGSVGYSAVRWTANTSPPIIALGKSRGATVGTSAIVQGQDTLGLIQFAGDDGTDLVSVGASIFAAVDGTPSTNDMPGRLVFATTPSGSNTPTERMRVHAGGGVSIGTSVEFSVASGSNDGFSFAANGTASFSRDNNPTLQLRRRSGNGSIVAFYRDTTNVGTISVTTTATAYNTSSDYRLKQNVEPMVGGLAKLAALAPKTFEFKAEPNVKVDGFLAHEVQAVVSQAVTGEKDGEEMQGLDHSKLVPVLVAALQELAAKVAALEAA